eukprot:scaffold277608_cov27-Tisochrysis_lutea.AAC.1
MRPRSSGCERVKEWRRYALRLVVGRVERFVGVTCLVAMQRPDTALLSNSKSRSAERGPC